MSTLRSKTVAGKIIAGMAPIANRMRFAVGKDPFGRWVALEEHGWAGGFFRSRDDAIRYAQRECGGQPDAVRLVRRRLLLPF